MPYVCSLIQCSMKYSILTAFLFFASIVLYSQTRAVTELGDTIYIYNNGTWSYDMLEESPEVNELSFLNESIPIDTVSKQFTYTKTAKKEVENSFGMFKIKYDDSKWRRVPPASLNDEAEFAFESKDTDIWCIVISEETPIKPDLLFSIARQSIKEKMGTDPEVIKSELRTINGHEVVRGAMKANISGIAFIFDTYYFSNDKGSVQFTTWTGEAIWKREQENILEFLNGFIAQ